MCVKSNWSISNLHSESERKYSNRTRTIAGSPPRVCPLAIQKQKTHTESLFAGYPYIPWMPEVFSLTSGEGRSERVVLVGERTLAQVVKSFEWADPIMLLFISPESRFDPGNLIGRLKKRVLKRAVIG